MHLLPRSHHTRRPWVALAGIAAILGVALVPISAASARADSHHVDHPKPTIVLVHGAWADGSSWNRVASHLQHEGYTVDVPPVGLHSIAGDAAALDAYLDAVVPTGPVVLVGHSYGGAVITNAAVGMSRVKALVYVNAYIPAKGETLAGLTATEPGSQVLDPAAFVPVPIPGGGGDVDLYLKPNLFRPALANDVPAGKAAVMQASQRPLPFSVLSEVSGVPAWASIPSWSIFGTQDHAIPPAEQAFMGHRAGAAITQIDASHLSMVSHPDAVTRVIERAAREVSR